MALSLTGYLAYASLMTGEVAGCGGGNVWDCGHVLHSRWAKVFGVPVSVPAFGLYSVLLGSLLVIRPSATKTQRRVAWGVLTMGALAAGMAAVWFIGLQTFSVGRLCAYCIASHTCGLILCAAILWKRPVGSKATAVLSSISVLAVGVMITAQLMATPPETFKIERFAELEAPQPVAATASITEAPGAAPAAEQGEVEVFEPF